MKSILRVGKFHGHRAIGPPLLARRYQIPAQANIQQTASEGFVHPAGAHSKLTPLIFS